MAIAGCHEEGSDDDGQDGGNSDDDGQDGGNSDDDEQSGKETEQVETTQIGSSGAGSLTIRGGPNLHLATLESNYTVYRSQRPLNDEYVYFTEISASFKPQQGPGYKGNLMRARVTVEAFADDLRLIKADPENERYVIDERNKSESYDLGLSVRESGANVGYSSTYRTHDGVVYPDDITKGHGGHYTLGWARGNADVYTPVVFHGLVTFRSPTKYDNLAGWRMSQWGKAEPDQNVV